MGKYKVDINDIDVKLKRDLTNAITLCSSNVSHMEYLLKCKYVSKKKMRKELKKQIEYIKEIEKTKNYLLTILK
jgi:hypothetical protein